MKNLKLSYLVEMEGPYSILDWIPFIGCAMDVKRSKLVWKELDELLASRGAPLFDFPPGSPHDIVRAIVSKKAQEVASWTTDYFSSDDDVGAVFWSYQDALEGTQGLIDLEEIFQLPDRRLTSDEWSEGGLGKMIDAIVIEGTLPAEKPDRPASKSTLSERFARLLHRG